MNFLSGLSQRSSMKPMKVCFYGDSVLRKKAKAIESVTDEVRQLAERMIVTMLQNDPPGVGLAGPQVGVSLRIITIATVSDFGELLPTASPGERLLVPKMPLAILNPEVVPASSRTEICSEGCLSVPELYGDVERPASVRLKGLDLDGNILDVECGGLLSRCLQHEVDHLNGVLFVDRLQEAEKEEVAADLDALERHTKKQLKKAKRH